MARTARERIDGDTGSSEVLAALVEALTLVGPFEVEEKQTSFHVVNGRAFLGIHPRKGGLLVNVVLDHALETDRLHRSEQVSASRWHHEFLLGSPRDLDAEFLGWVKAAYGLTVTVK
ncbi:MULTISPECIES: DUF5655 domain-containing protein [Paenarthrobacter]|uniref:DUF5655 domain-containing protein n=1 Tax=Paenarthrobacter aromaticivorans TaxID=2849150 RepID=A0ABS6I9N1_9MICC|nr:DUF5655 domain-containing protein [Paenarthrobacter sp. MMS21-TAE1-1]MBU8868426.1 hypothetical protein [Paenarthrobacter sp. MMS21-TAE1-1]